MAVTRPTYGPPAQAGGSLPEGGAAGDVLLRDASAQYGGVWGKAPIASVAGLQGALDAKLAVNGSGSQLTGLNASAVTTGTLSTSRLHPTVARTNSANPFTVKQRFTVPVLAGDASGQVDFTNVLSGQGVCSRFNMLTAGGWHIGFQTREGFGWFEITNNGTSVVHRWDAYDYVLASGGRVGWSREGDYATPGAGAVDVALRRRGPGVLRLDGQLDADGVVLTSPNGTRYRLRVGDDGALTTEAAGA